MLLPFNQITPRLAGSLQESAVAVSPEVHRDFGYLENYSYSRKRTFRRILALSDSVRFPDVEPYAIAISDPYTKKRRDVIRAVGVASISRCIPRLADESAVEATDAESPGLDILGNEALIGTYWLGLDGRFYGDDVERQEAITSISTTVAELLVPRLVMVARAEGLAPVTFLATDGTEVSEPMRGHMKPVVTGRWISPVFNERETYDMLRAA